MKKLYLLFLLIFIAGCSSRDPYTPESGKEVLDIEKKESIGASITYSLRDGATLDDGTFIVDDKIIKDKKLKEGFYFINESKSYYISASRAGDIELIDKSNSKKRINIKIKYDGFVIGASAENNMLAVTTSNNTVAIYNIDTKSLLFVNRGEKAFISSTKFANPMFMDDVVLIPYIDGKVAVIDKNSMRYSRDITLGKKGIIDNIIYMQSTSSYMLIASTNKILLFSKGNMYSYEDDIRDAKIIDNSPYVINVNGEIIKFNRKLKIIKRKKFKHAQLLGFVAYNSNTISLVEAGGFLLKVKKDFTDYDIYAIDGEIESKLYLGYNKIYYGDNIYKSK